MLSIAQTPLSAVTVNLLWAIFTQFMYRINIGGLINERSNHNEQGWFTASAPCHGKA